MYYSYYSNTRGVTRLWQLVWVRPHQARAQATPPPSGSVARRPDPAATARGRGPGGFMADSRRSLVGHGREQHWQHPDGWQVVSRRRQWCQLPCPTLPPPSHPRRPMPIDDIGRYFNCLRPDHMAAECTNVARCLRCQREGHQAWSCKRPWSPDVAGPPRQQQRQSTVAILHPRRGDIVLGVPSGLGRSSRSPSGGCTPLDMVTASMLEGSPSHHTLPSQPPPPLPLEPAQEPHHQTGFELRVIPRTPAMEAAEAGLSNALVAHVVGAWRTMTMP
jgi:hypothetical protein